MSHRVTVIAISCATVLCLSACGGTNGQAERSSTIGNSSAPIGSTVARSDSTGPDITGSDITGSSTTGSTVASAAGTTTSGSTGPLAAAPLTAAEIADLEAQLDDIDQLLAAVESDLSED
jgi:hypothetical protein